MRGRRYNWSCGVASSKAHLPSRETKKCTQIHTKNKQICIFISGEMKQLFNTRPGPSRSTTRIYPNKIPFSLQLQGLRCKMQLLAKAKMHKCINQVNMTWQKSHCLWGVIHNCWWSQCCPIVMTGLEITHKNKCDFRVEGWHTVLLSMNHQPKISMYYQQQSIP